MAAYHKAKLVSHAQRVLRLYKKCIRAVNLRRGFRHHLEVYENHLGFYDGFLVMGAKSKDILKPLDEEM